MYFLLVTYFTAQLIFVSLFTLFLAVVDANTRPIPNRGRTEGPQKEDYSFFARWYTHCITTTTLSNHFSVIFTISQKDILPHPVVVSKELYLHINMVANSCLICKILMLVESFRPEKRSHFMLKLLFRFRKRHSGRRHFFLFNTHDLSSPLFKHCDHGKDEAQMQT